MIKNLHLCSLMHQRDCTTDPSLKRPKEHDFWNNPYKILNRFFSGENTSSPPPSAPHATPHPSLLPKEILIMRT